MAVSLPTTVTSGDRTEGESEAIMLHHPWEACKSEHPMPHAIGGRVLHTAAHHRVEILACAKLAESTHRLAQVAQL